MVERDYSHHENMIIAIENGVMKIQQEDGEWIEAAVSSGFAQIINNRVLVLVLSAEKPEEIDIRRAQEAKERAEEQLRQKQSLQEYHISQASLSRAITRIKKQVNTDRNSRRECIKKILQMIKRISSEVFFCFRKRSYFSA